MPPIRAALSAALREIAEERGRRLAAEQAARDEAGRLGCHQSPVMFVKIDARHLRPAVADLRQQIAAADAGEVAEPWVNFSKWLRIEVVL